MRNKLTKLKVFFCVAVFVSAAAAQELDQLLGGKVASAPVVRGKWGSMVSYDKWGDTTGGFYSQTVTSTASEGITINKWNLQIQYIDGKNGVVISISPETYYNTTKSIFPSGQKVTISLRSENKGTPQNFSGTLTPKEIAGGNANMAVIECNDARIVSALEKDGKLVILIDGGKWHIRAGINGEMPTAANKKLWAKREAELQARGEEARKTISEFTDPRDGKKYKTVKIGKQVWMAENLNYAMEGSRHVAEGSRCADGSKNCLMYGGRYDWASAKAACPDGWHLPNREEWETLVNFAGGGEIAVNKLKAASGWKDYYPVKPGNGEDAFGFAALPGGAYYPSGGSANVGSAGQWWVAGDDPVYYLISNNNYSTYTKNEKDLFRVRCVRD
jgi:uncharacterized protein (TIGR02145 family)